MLRIACLAFATAIIGSCSSPKVNTATTNAAPNTLTAQEKKDGWQLLFDGKSTAGWHTYGYEKVNKEWVIADDALSISTASKSEWTQNESHDILTNEAYDNYHLKMDWRISRNGNSGIIFFVNEDKAKYRATYETGLEMQVIDNDGHPDAKIPKHRAGDLYDLVASSLEPVKAVGEWNRAEIISNKGKLDFYLNGVHIVNTTLWNDNWKQMVANSKFKSMPAFGTFHSGKIALQEHGNDVWYRNIKIKKL
jgi:hypothetical protein